MRSWIQEGAVVDDALNSPVTASSAPAGSAAEDSQQGEEEEEDTSCISRMSEPLGACQDRRNQRARVVQGEAPSPSPFASSHNLSAHQRLSESRHSCR
eukprot:197598-Hanusia_phi.AAC.1